MSKLEYKISDPSLMFCYYYVREPAKSDGQWGTFNYLKVPEIIVGIL